MLLLPPPGVRYCCECGRRIHLCMGCVLARDLLDFQDGKRLNVREHCGRCVIRWLLNHEFGDATYKLAAYDKPYSSNKKE